MPLLPCYRMPFRSENLFRRDCSSIFDRISTSKIFYNTKLLWFGVRECVCVVYICVRQVIQFSALIARLFSDSRCHARTWARLVIYVTSFDEARIYWKIHAPSRGLNFSYLEHFFPRRRHLPRFLREETFLRWYFTKSWALCNAWI